MNFVNNFIINFIAIDPNFFCIKKKKLIKIFNLIFSHHLFYFSLVLEKIQIFSKTISLVFF